MDDSSIRFNLKNGTEVLKFCLNGDIFVKGKLIENDKQVVDGIREFLTLAMPGNVKIDEKQEGN